MSIHSHSCKHCGKKLTERCWCPDHEKPNVCLDCSHEFYQKEVFEHRLSLSNSLKEAGLCVGAGNKHSLSVQSKTNPLYWFFVIYVGPNQWRFGYPSPRFSSDEVVKRLTAWANGDPQTLRDQTKIDCPCCGAHRRGDESGVCVECASECNYGTEPCERDRKRLLPLVALAEGIATALEAESAAIRGNWTRRPCDLCGFDDGVMDVYVVESASFRHKECQEFVQHHLARTHEEVEQ